MELAQLELKGPCSVEMKAKHKREGTRGVLCSVMFSRCLVRLNV